MDLKQKKISYCGIEFEDDAFVVYNNKLSSYEGFVSAKLFYNCENGELDLYIRDNFYHSLETNNFSHKQKISCARKALFAMETLLNNFDEFEESFYEYAEAPEPIN